MALRLCLLEERSIRKASADHTEEPADEEPAVAICVSFCYLFQSDQFLFFDFPLCFAFISDSTDQLAAKRLSLYFLPAS
jgi:hypothetical protein